MDRRIAERQTRNRTSASTRGMTCQPWINPCGDAAVAAKPKKYRHEHFSPAAAPRVGRVAVLSLGLRRGPHGFRGRGARGRAAPLSGDRAGRAALRGDSGVASRAPGRRGPLRRSSPVEFRRRSGPLHRSNRQRTRGVLHPRKTPRGASGSARRYRLGPLPRGETSGTSRPGTRGPTPSICSPSGSS